MLSFQEIKPKLPKRSLSNLFTKKSSLENLCSFLTPKEKFRLLCNSKEISKEFDSRIDDVFMPREYQDKIKSYGNYFEELFFQISQEMKRKAEKKGERIKLYEFEENMVKYLKYLVKKFDKIISTSPFSVKKNVFTFNPITGKNDANNINGVYGSNDNFIGITMSDDLSLDYAGKDKVLAQLASEGGKETD